MRVPVPRTSARRSGPRNLTALLRDDQGRPSLLHPDLAGLLDLVVLPVDDRLRAQLLEELGELAAPLLVGETIGDVAARLVERLHRRRLHRLDLDQLKAARGAEHRRQVSRLQAVDGLLQLRREHVARRPVRPGRRWPSTANPTCPPPGARTARRPSAACGCPRPWPWLRLPPPRSRPRSLAGTATSISRSVSCGVVVNSLVAVVVHLQLGVGDRQLLITSVCCTRGMIIVRSS